jgi:hypothetical protein
MLALFYFATISLLALPFFKFGPGNDLVMRGSTVPLVIVAFIFGGIVCHPAISRRTRLIGYALIVLSTPSALLEFRRNIMSPHYNISDCTLMEARLALGDNKGVPTNYAVESANVPSWLMETKVLAPLNARSRRCWTDIDNRQE